MIAIPAVDLRDGACVQLVGGSYKEERIRLENPVEVARSWEHFGFSRLHVVDLDAATGRGSNRSIVRSILEESQVPVQVGGGIRSGDLVEELLDAGATQVIVGTRALEELEWLAGIAGSRPGEIIVACDVRERRVTTRGWVRTLPLDILDAVDELNALPLGGLLVTAVHREGQLQGTDLPLMEDVAEASHVPVYASGGVSSMQDLRALEHRGIAGAVIGMALYTGVLDPTVVAGEFRE
ncbi:MAG: 1-(5-phosphoribosyl)-5-[(5-phosphoribosylamino)methylideneamino]imidazole-4-carboxamide isomerase [Gemmatimonadaceae bacterium]|nr:1-(5-phosphoribosyl)-5-[(5-phosphoribosylamino)methylideneamino]imidazole-4-carboxamide isomerase [Gemmatimonadaceae bacterium]NUO93084.1 1-(5-phosphoribosyl)-5-[(5-phosphoribosylamino)methylideneamino]imidazole-4-carboxamide isomerase [Gemmatimonadaceae bacterium]NUP55585.1 1-(5-phosphoribosyl)-5-[(5-phosphoribosylamino)methylideneamino]imidazole-4-carboxamide isomerase [Gemmatimonadaceae bacterium]NUP71275.1 1-(5-phosphoribosyl)-5-[(5-phosphoribosylamino)methylideneamino]imidazole-4-carboxa